MNVEIVGVASRAGRELGNITMGRNKVEGDGDESDVETVRTVLTSQKHEVILVVRLESSNPLRKRFLVMVSAPAVAAAPPAASNMISRKLEEKLSLPTRSYSASKGSELDYCLLGVDCCQNRSEECGVGGEVSIGFVLKILWGTKISLDGDGGFSVRQCGRHHVFKPASVQALWTAIQTLHLIIGRLKPKRHSLCLQINDWVKEYEKSINSPQSCINEWNVMPDLLVRRAPSLEDLTGLSADEVNQETRKCLIKSKLRQIMQTVDLDEITSKSIRLQLERELVQRLDDFKAYIDQEILHILGQMDPASKIFDFLYLGSEWNASNLEELNSNGVTHILNVTREIDNFFPSVFKYLNIREYDLEETNLLRYWDKTYNFIKDCLSEGGRVLVHCKMGISRSASTVVAFAMKYFEWDMTHALGHVKGARGIVEPNKGFMEQLSVYEGILEASRQRITFRKTRSKSESHVESLSPGKKGDRKPVPLNQQPRTPSESSIAASCDRTFNVSLQEKQRPKSWSPSSSSEEAVAAAAQMGEGEREEPRVPIICHCYSQLAQYFTHNLAVPTHIGGSYNNRSSTPVSDDPPSEGTDCDGNRAVPEGVADVEAVNGELRVPIRLSEPTSCPAKSHINQCTCNFELELKVSEKPVNIEEPGVSAETELILRNLGNFPIHIRHNQRWSSPAPYTYGDEEVGGTCPDILAESRGGGSPDLLPRRAPLTLDCSGAEELSVKTLADMFDFKLGEEPSKPPLSARHNKLGDSKIEQIAKKLVIGDCSDC